MNQPILPFDHPSLLAFWDFSEARWPYVSKGQHAIELKPQAGPMEHVDDGPFGGGVRFREGQWLRSLRTDCAALDIHSPDATVTVLAWIRRRPKSDGRCEAVAGLWDEMRRCRQYALFLAAMNQRDRQVGHVSDVGGPTPGDPYCQTGSVGETRLPFDQWLAVGFSYDGQQVSSYLNGKPDGQWERNPEPFTAGLYNSGLEGADFTVGAVRRSNAPGDFDNFFVGDLGGLAVFDRALDETEIAVWQKACM